MYIRIVENFYDWVNRIERVSRLYACSAFVLGQGCCGWLSPVAGQLRVVVGFGCDLGSFVRIVDHWPSNFLFLLAGTIIVIVF
jgi:hypothetical protein